jgi:hypothetical protein
MLFDLLKKLRKALAGTARTGAIVPELMRCPEGGR